MDRATQQSLQRAHAALKRLDAAIDGMKTGRVDVIFPRGVPAVEAFSARNARWDRDVPSLADQPLNSGRRSWTQAQREAHSKKMKKSWRERRRADRRSRIAFESLVLRTLPRQRLLGA